MSGDTLAPPDLLDADGTGDQGRRPSRRRWLVATALLLAVCGWGAVAASRVLQAGLELREARGELVAAARELDRTDLSAARTRLNDGVELAASASERLEGPVIQPLRFVPVVSSNLRAASALAAAARDAGGATEGVLEAATAIVHGDGDAERGEISLDHLAQLRAPMRRLADELERSTAAVQAAGSGSLLGPVQDARDAYLELAVPATEQAAVGAEIVEVMPQFLGVDRPRRYLVGAVALSELRATGGLMGSWSILTADAGHLDVETFADIDAIQPAGADVAAPSEEFAERYADLGALRQWRNANLTPDLPSAAEVMLELWDGGGGEPLDGVILADPVTFSRIAELSGPLEVPDTGQLHPADVVPFVGLEAYETFPDEDTRKEVLGAVATTAFERVFDILEDDDVPRTVHALAELAGGGHLRVFSRDEQVQAALVRAGVAGELPDVAGEFAGIFVNNVAGNKVDYFTTRTLEHHVRLLPDGVTEALLSVTFDNTAPTEGYSRSVLGPWTPHTEVGDNLSLVSFVCGSACTLHELPDGIADGGTDRGHPIADAHLRVPAGQQRTVQVRTRTDSAWSREGDQIVVPVSHLVQPTLRPSSLQVRLAIPTGWSPIELPDGAWQDGDEVRWEAATSGHEELTFRFARAAERP